METIDKSRLYDQLFILTNEGNRTWPNIGRLRSDPSASNTPAEAIQIPDSFLEEVLDMRLRGDSYAKIANRLNRSGIKAVHGGRWYLSSLSQYMQRRCCVLMCTRAGGNPDAIQRAKQC